MNNFEFSVFTTSGTARRGILKSPHGDIQTPAFVTVGTKGTVKSLTPDDIQNISTQFIFVNTYHMVLSPGLELLKKAGGIRNLSHINKPLITDSGGFQVFSLAGNSARKGTFGTDEAPASLVKIDDNGVEFRSPVDGTLYYFTPEFSVQAQKIIGADFMVAFDECAAAGATFKYTQKAMIRTHHWAERSIKEFEKEPVCPSGRDSSTNFTAMQASLGEKNADPGQARMTHTPVMLNSFQHLPSSTENLSDSLQSHDQRLYGVIQGGQFEELRKISAEYIASLPFFGLAIGGVAVGEGKEQMREQVKWVQDVLGKDLRPKHLLGIGEIDDIFAAVEAGMDTMDCVTPTRHARMGRLYCYGQKDGNNLHEIDILKSVYKSDFNPIDTTCKCYSCKTFNRAYIHHLFKQKELLAYRLATIHNLFFMERLFEEIRNSIEEDRFVKLKEKWM